MYSIKRIFNPEIYQGKHRNRNYFEGWYFKIIDKSSRNIFAIIPGVSIANNDKHAFIQFIDAISGRTYYLKYSIDDFSYSEEEFDISIGNNRFNKNGLNADFKTEDFNVFGYVKYINIVHFPKSILNPGIMGPFSFVPFMECHHGILNIHCELDGVLTIGDKQIDFSGGYGYLEKDWGSSFPQSWIWLQSNHFEESNATVMFSIASIPWMGIKFDGLISFLRIDNTLYKFATYSKAEIKKLCFEKNILSILIEDSKYILSLSVAGNKGGILKAPKNGMMDVEITESITSIVDVVLSDKRGHVIFKGLGKNTGLELAGNYKQFVR